jgi:hypothetical protein
MDLRLSILHTFPTQFKMSLLSNIRVPVGVLAGFRITKDMRHEVFGQVAGGAGSRAPEIFQRKKIEEGTGLPCPKTSMRINLRTHQCKEIAHPNVYADGFDYSEDFDGKQVFGDKQVFVNLKCIVGKGGAQTRSLREVYAFVEGQLNVLKKESSVYFANILDGDESHNVADKFQYLLTLPEYADVKSRVYVGDLLGYFPWIASVVSK